MNALNTQPNVLLIWELIPENTEAYLIKNLSPDDMGKLLTCHMKFINFGSFENETWLSDFVEAHKADKLELEKGPIDFNGIVIVSGFGL